MPSTVICCFYLHDFFHLQFYIYLPCWIYFSYKTLLFYLQGYSSVLFLPGMFIPSVFCTFLHTVFISASVLYCFSLQGLWHLESFIFSPCRVFVIYSPLLFFSLRGLCQLEFCTVSPWKVYVSYSSVQFLLGKFMSATVLYSFSLTENPIPEGKRVQCCPWVSRQRRAWAAWHSLVQTPVGMVVSAGYNIVYWPNIICTFRTIYEWKQQGCKEALSGS